MIHKLAEEFSMLWPEYALADDDTLTDKAILLKKALIELSEAVVYQGMEG